MKIYVLKNDAENFRWLEYKGNWFNFFDEVLNSKPISNFNERIECTTIRDKKERVPGDFPCFTVPALSENAKNILEPYFEGLAQFFPLDVKKYGTYYFLNIFNILDCLDTTNSDIEYFESGKIFCINSYSFKNVSDKKLLRIFKLKRNERGEVYTNEEIKQIIEDNNLSGFKFIEVGEAG